MRSGFLRLKRLSIWGSAGGALVGCGSSTPATVSNVVGDGGGGTRTTNDDSGGTNPMSDGSVSVGDGSFPIPAGIGTGGACSASTTCRPGLACGADAKCALGHSLPAGSACVLNGECAAGNICAAASLTIRKCVPGGKGAAGSTCQSDVECADGLRCAIVGFGTQCSPEGSGDLKAACKTSTDCLGGLACLSGACNVTIPGIPTFGFPTWAGETCEADSGPPISHFRVPRGTGDKDFYRLPFPNDIRTKNGHPDLTGHPTPGPELLGFDPVDCYLRAIEAENDGFSTYPTVDFRFNTQFKTCPAATTSRAACRLVDVTKNDPDFGHGYPVGMWWLGGFGGSAYICRNYLAFRLSDGTR